MRSHTSRRRAGKTLLGASMFAGLALTGSGIPGQAAPSAERAGVLSCDLGVGLEVLGLTSGGELVCFEADDPGATNVIGEITGLDRDTRLVGIDVRPATGDLYGLGNRGGVYTIDTDTAEATFQVRLTAAITGDKWGIDFNPAVDRLRIIADNGQNLRADVTTGMTTVDGTLNNPSAMPAPITRSRGLSGAAYTNNDADAGTATTLFDIDGWADQVAVQAPANAGALSPTGKLGKNVKGETGFDIYSTIEDGTTVSNDAYAVVGEGGDAVAFLEIDLLTGKANRVGATGETVVDIAIPLNQSTPL